MTTEEPPFSASTTSCSLLDKPLHQLTEDDISQLTREDCRRYLKQKGMRRPSWNKSQAIQQVIMLKALLEPSPESGAGGRKLYMSRQHQTPTTRVQKVTSGDKELYVSTEESVPGHRNDTYHSDLPGDNDSISPRITSVTDEAKGQMAIFYSGKVNVYDDVSAEKAQALLQLAASPLQFPQESPFDGNVPICPLKCNSQAPSIKVSADSSAMFMAASQTARMTENSRIFREESSVSREDNTVEGSSASRKASVQRYLEKRKDRFKGKRKAGAAAASPSLDVYLSHQIRNNQNEQSRRSEISSPLRVRPPSTPNPFN